MKYKLKKYLKTALKETASFVKNNKSSILTLAAYALVIPVMGECTAAIESASSGIGAGESPLTKPLKTIAEVMTGPIPMGFTLISGATTAISWGAGWEQSITQRAMKCLGGGAVATGAGQGFQWAGLDSVTGCLM